MYFLASAYSERISEIRFAYLNRFSYLNEGVERQELGICARGLNSVMIGMYKQNMLGFMHAHNIYEFFARTTVCVLRYATFNIQSHASLST